MSSLNLSTKSNKLNMLLKETILSRQIHPHDSQAYIEDRKTSLMQSNLRKQYFIENCDDNTAANLHTLYDAYSHSLRNMTKKLRIHKIDTKSYKIRRDIDIHIGDIFEVIEDNRDNFCDLVILNFEEDRAIQELKKYAEILKPATQIWIDITKRCTGFTDYQTQNKNPFNFDLDSYTGHFVTVNTNGAIKLRIPTRVLVLYVNTLMTTFSKLKDYYKTIRNMAITTPKPIIN